MSVVVVATIRPLLDHREEVIAAFVRTIAQVHTEEGCVLYALHEMTDRLIVIEQWESQRLLDAHSTSAALARLGPSLEGKVAGAAEVLVLNAIPAGNGDKGRLRP